MVKKGGIHTLEGFIAAIIMILSFIYVTSDTVKIYEEQQHIKTTTKITDWNKTYNISYVIVKQFPYDFNSLPIEIIYKGKSYNTSTLPENIKITNNKIMCFEENCEIILKYVIGKKENKVIKQTYYINSYNKTTYVIEYE